MKSFAIPILIWLYPTYVLNCHFLYKAMNYHLSIYPASLQKISIRNKRAVICTSSGNVSTINVLFTANLFLNYVYLLLMGVHMPRCVHGGQSTTCKSPLFPSIMWVPEIKLKSLGLAAGTFTPETSRQPLHCNIERDL